VEDLMRSGLERHVARDDVEGKAAGVEQEGARSWEYRPKAQARPPLAGHLEVAEDHQLLLAPIDSPMAGFVSLPFGCEPGRRRRPRTWSW
jgi:hypothetical protein